MDDPTGLPTPLTLPDCDLRGLPWFPVVVADLRDGAMAALADPEARWAAIFARAVAWHQVPAASLPAEDTALCRLLGFGRDVAAWLPVREAGALTEWVKCADGRLYHPALAERARDAWQARQKRQVAGAKGNAKRWDRGNRGNAVAEGSQCDRNAIVERSPKDRRGDVEETIEEASLRSAVTSDARPDPKTDPRGMRLPEDWQPDGADRAFARALHLGADTIAAEFLRYWCAKAGKDARKVNWHLTWQTWCTRAAKDAGIKGRGQGSQRPARPTNLSALTAEVAGTQAASPDPLTIDANDPTLWDRAA